MMSQAPEPPDVVSSNVTPGGHNHSGEHSPLGLRVWTIALTAGLLSGTLAWLAGEACLDLIKPTRFDVNSKGVMVLKVASRHNLATAAARNAGLAFVLLGVAFGGGMGLAGGLIVRSGRLAARGALLGVMLGAFAGGAASALLLPPFNMYKDRHPDEASNDLILPLLVHVAIWGAIGGAGALGFAVGLGAGRNVGRIVIGGLIGAAIGATIYELVGAIAFPSAGTAQFISETWPTRLFARLIVTLFAAIATVLTMNGANHRDASTS